MKAAIIGFPRTIYKIRRDFDLENIEYWKLKKIAAEEFITEKVHNIRTGKTDIQGVFGVNDFSSLVAAIISSRSGLVGSSPVDLLKVQSKKYLRKYEQRFFPDLHIKSKPLRKDNLDKILDSISPPVFLKPEISKLSRFSYVAENEEKIKEYFNIWTKNKTEFNRKVEVILDILTPEEKEDFIFENDYLIEEYIDLPQQITIEGFIFDGEVVLYSTVGSDFIDDTLSFNKFKFPYQWKDNNFKNKVFIFVKEFVKKSPLNNSLFNIEIRLDPKKEKFHLIELNTRISIQFLFFYRHVLEFNPLETGRKIALGQKPVVKQDSLDNHKVGMCFILRKKEDRMVDEVPSEAQIQRLVEAHEDKDTKLRINIFVSKGRLLSSIKQDPDTYRYGEVKIVSIDQRKIKEIFNSLKPELEDLFTFI